MWLDVADIMARRRDNNMEKRGHRSKAYWRMVVAV